jgi:hypothetical protein
VISCSRIACSASAMPATNPLDPLPTLLVVLTDRKRSLTIIATMRTKAYLFAEFLQENAQNHFWTVSGKLLARKEEEKTDEKDSLSIEPHEIGTLSLGQMSGQPQMVALGEGGHAGPSLHKQSQCGVYESSAV